MVTLNDLVSRRRTPPPAGSHEVVRAPDGMNHLVVITQAHDIIEDGHTVREFAFHSWCNRGDLHASKLEVVVGGSITCLTCIQWRNS